MITEGRFRLGEEIIKSERSNPPEGVNQEGRSTITLRVDKARVYRAEDLKTGQVVAVKVLNQGCSKAADFKVRFESDSQSIQFFEHPNIIRHIESGFTAEGQPYFVTEYLKGQTLGALISAQGQISPEVMGDYLRQIASALDAAHDRDIFHCDLNPSRIMLHSEGGDQLTVKLLDLGLGSDLLKPKAGDVELTGRETTLGTAAYLSPEQARGQTIDRRSDVYSLGVTLYEALTGRLPFSGKTDFQIILAKVNGTTPRFPENWSSDPRASALEAVVLKAMARDPAERPASAGELSDLFQKSLHQSRVPRIRLSWPALLAGVVLASALVLLVKWLS